MIYLASPYSSPDPLVRELRYYKALHCAQWFLRRRVWVYSPIVHCHPMAVKYTLPGDHQFWQDYDEAAIDAMREIYVLMIDGWKESSGVQSEIKYAGQGIDVYPISYIRPFDESYIVQDHP